MTSPMGKGESEEEEMMPMLELPLTGGLKYMLVKVQLLGQMYCCRGK